MCGYTTASIAFIATAASSALPPAASTRSPTSVAVRCGLATAPARSGGVFGVARNRSRGGC